MDINIGDIFYADLSQVIGAEQGGIRPVVIISNDIGNKHSHTVVVASVTSQISEAKLPTHVKISADKYGLQKDCVVLLEQIRTVDKKRLKNKIGCIDNYDMKQITKALMIELSLSEKINAISNGEYSSKEIEKSINKAVKILEELSRQYGLNQVLNKEEDEKKYKDLYKEVYLELSKDSDEKYYSLVNEVSEMHKTVKPVIKKMEVAKGQINEFAVVDYFKKHGYEAIRASSEFDHLKIDVVAENQYYKVFIQVKNGQIGKSEVSSLVKNVKELGFYSNLTKVVAIVAGEFPRDGEFYRLLLEEQYKISIMFIHKSQVLNTLPEFKRSLG